MARSYRASALGLLVLSIASLGCDGQQKATVNTIADPPDARQTNTRPNEREQADAISKETTTDVTVAIVDRADFNEVIAKHRGKVILVDFWATWCGPCREQFPHTVDISRKYGKQELVVVSVSMDEAESEKDVVAFLNQSGASFEHLISSYGISQKGFEAFELGDGGIPHYKIYDRDGVIQHTTNDPGEIEVRIKELLANRGR